MKIIESELNKSRRIIDKVLREYMDINITYQNKILKSMEYSLFTGGKRLRPIISMKTFEMFKGEIGAILPFASSIEMIHTYSLIHDDLPSMDNDEFRRGKPTNHMVFGEAMAILAGNGLLNYAFEIMARDIYTNSNSLDEYKNKTRAMIEISNCSGVQGMIGGQVIDLLSSHSNTNDEEIFSMYKLKTAALFQASIVTGAIIANANENEIEILRKFGLYIGMSYQIQDDLLDIKEDYETNKHTYLKHFTKENAIKYMMYYNEKALEMLDKLEGRNTEFLRSLANYLINREK